MAVTVHWNDTDQTVQVYETAVRVEQPTPRDTFQLIDQVGVLVALIPDFGVRAIVIS